MGSVHEALMESVVDALSYATLERIPDNCKANAKYSAARLRESETPVVLEAVDAAVAGGLAADEVVKRLLQREGLWEADWLAGEALARLVFDHGADATLSENNLSVAHVAAQWGPERLLLRALTLAPGQVNEQGPEGLTPLQMVVLRSHDDPMLLGELESTITALADRFDADPTVVMSAKAAPARLEGCFKSTSQWDRRDKTVLCLFEQFVDVRVPEVWPAYLKLYKATCAARREGRPVCTVCGQVPGGHRCGQCRTARYCSVGCQRFHWTHGLHKRACAAATTPVDETSKELS